MRLFRQKYLFTAKNVLFLSRDYANDDHDGTDHTVCNPAAGALQKEGPCHLALCFRGNVSDQSAEAVGALGRIRPSYQGGMGRIPAQRRIQAPVLPYPEATDPRNGRIPPSTLPAGRFLHLGRFQRHPLYAPRAQYQYGHRGRRALSSRVLPGRPPGELSRAAGSSQSHPGGVLQVWQHLRLHRPAYPHHRIPAGQV